MNTIPMQGVAVRLARRALHEIEDAAGVQLACSEGTLWLTLDDDPRDIILSAGESFVTAEHRRAIIYALEAASFTLRMPQPQPMPATAAAPSWREKSVGLRPAH